MKYQSSGPCKDTSLELVQTRATMELAGWDVNMLTDLSSYIKECGNSTFVGYKGEQGTDGSEGTVSTRFKGFGRASLHFGNCGSTSANFVKALLNDKFIASAFANQNSSVNFYYKSKDELKFITQNYHQQQSHKHSQQHPHQRYQKQQVQPPYQGPQHQNIEKRPQKSHPHQQQEDYHRQSHSPQGQQKPNIRQPHQQHRLYHKDYFTTPAVQSLPPSSPSRPYKQVVRPEAILNVVHQEKQYPTKRPFHKKKHEKVSTKNLSRQKKLKQRLNQVLKIFIIFVFISAIKK